MKMSSAGLGDRDCEDASAKVHQAGKQQSHRIKVDPMASLSDICRVTPNINQRANLLWIV